MDSANAALPEPPANPEEWTHEQWLDWLKATDGGAPAEHGAVPITAMGRIVHTPGGQLLGQAMTAMANAIFGRKDDEIVIVAEGGSEPETDQPFLVHLDPDQPARSFVVFRPDAEPST